MRPMLLALAVSTGLASPTPDALASELEIDSGQDALIHCGQLIDVVEQRVLEQQQILVRDGRIEQIGTTVSAAEGLELIDLGDKVCMPGLMDMHVHLFVDVLGQTVDQSAPTRSSAENALAGLRNAQDLLRLGFTTVRVPGDMDYHYAGIALRDSIQRGEHLGPRMFVAPHAISATGGHGDFNTYAPDLPHRVMGPKIADGVDGVRLAVREQIKYGADWIKVMASGGVMSQHDDPEVAGYSAEEFEAMADETHRHRKKITAHAHGDAGIRAAVEAGFDSIEHGTMMSAETARLMAEKGTFYVPTLYVLDWILERGATGGISADNLRKAELVGELHSQSVRLARDSGVRLIIGSDPIFPMEQAIREFTSLAKRVRDHWVVLQAGTINPATMLGIEADLGSLEVGKIADLVATERSPLERMEAIEHVGFVMKAGEVVHNEWSRP